MLLGAAGLLGVDALLVAGGAQAVGALAYGLPDEGLEPVDLIVGPGNAWVTAAKIEVVGEVGIDLPAGPSEGIVLADGNADAATSPRISSPRPSTGWTPLPCSSPGTRRSPTRVEVEVGRRLATAPPARHPRPVARRPRPHRARAPTSTPGIDFVNGYGPEHLSVDVEDLEGAVARHPQRGLASSWAVVARNSPATTPRAPTTSCPQAASPAPAARSPSRRTASSSRSSGSPARAWPHLRPVDATSPKPRA